uniref:Anaphase-promoting complex subunit 5 n=1 Tax=Teratosphaeria destructans TaxID=418781 RepID=A0A6C0T4Q9_9PEZI|nr:putative anaphase-promoting complex subunit 5 protein [Teratosphaeria destructans]
MPRYLTPARVCSLVLIDIYLSADVDVASSAKLPLLSFIASRINATTATTTTATPTPPDPADVTVSADASALSTPLRQWESGVPGRSLYDHFLSRLWALEGLDSLHVFFEHLSQLIAPSQPGDKATGRRSVTRASPIGQYVRRCRVEFTRLQFHDTHSLWHAFVSFRASTYDTWASRNPEAARKYQNDQSAIAVDSPAWQSVSAHHHAEAAVSAEDVDRLLTASIHRLQKLGTRLPHEVQRRIREWVVLQSDQNTHSLRHFLAFFDHWKAGQYTMALESLHRYFDYSLVTKSGSESMRVYYQYALLHLSVLHADFDCWEESIEAMDECIATARENHDTGCLNFALSWLLYLRQAKPTDASTPFGALSGLAAGGEQDEILFLKTKAKDTRNWSLLSSTLLEESKLEMYRSGSNAKSAELIVQSMVLNVQHDLRTLMPAAALFHGATVDRIGQASLTNRMYELIAANTDTLSPITDRVRASCRLAYGLAQVGQYAAALKLLGEMSVLADGVLKLQQRVMGFTLLVHFARSLRREDEDRSRHFFAALQPLRSFGDPETEYEIQLLELEWLIRRQELPEALRITNARIKQLKSNAGSDIAQRLHFLVLKARIFAAAEQPLKAFSIALRAASTAERLHLIPTALEAIAGLAHILNDLKEFDASRALLESAMPLMLETRQSQLVAQCFTILGESHVGMAGYACQANSTEQSHTMRIAETFIDRGNEVYEQLDDRAGMLECHAMKIRLAQWAGDDGSAAQAEALYAQISSRA